jgi:hypothetical protein
MRDLLFKNITSDDKRRKIIASSEILDKAGVRSTIRRHFVCMVKEVKGNQTQRPLPYLCVLKEHNTRKQKERFFCKIKGSVFAVSNGRLFLVVFMHSIKISLIAIPQDIVKYSAEE